MVITNYYIKLKGFPPHYNNSLPLPAKENFKAVWN